jgi:hypothetical protein
MLLRCKQFFEMTSRLLIQSLTIAFLLNSSFSFGQTYGNKQVANLKINQKEKPKVDTSKTAIIPLSKSGKWLFDNNYKSALLTQVEIDRIDSLILVCVTDYNNSLKQGYKQFSIDLAKHNYRKQVVAATNRKGEKEVWVNCFCRTWDDRWKTDLMIVDDGGNCYFNFKINLATNKIFELGVNGGA